jgi:UDP-N-acetylmuramoyl-L-alanyl-D-glutamate--2,6-diaminopimelate ligase
MLDKILFYIRKLIPVKLFKSLQPVYHYSMAVLGALIYLFPSRKLIVVGVTGTKGKSSVTEILNAILEEAGFKTAVSNTIRFKIDKESKNNLYKMSMPGRFFMQKFLSDAVDAQCKYAIIEMTSQGASMHRHKFISLDGFIFTNLAPEHIESHGSYEKYVEAKLSLAKEFGKSKKKNRVMIVNGEDRESPKFLAVSADKKIEYRLKDAEPYIVKKQGLSLTWDGKKIESPLSGVFNIENILAGATYAKTQNIDASIVANALSKFSGIRGRVERIELDPLDPARDKQDFNVIVDYAHTPDSLQKLYDVFQNTRRICVLGNTGGGRDTWKRNEMAQIAENECDQVILTNEDPYDDDPQQIINDMAGVMDTKPIIIMDRREAIAKALSLAKTGDSVLITGKGTDPYIMGPNNIKIPWDDATVTREELRKIKSRP